MKTAKLLAALGAVVMGATILYGFIVGNFFDEAAVLIHMPWFHVSMIDLYIGFWLFSGWIIYRERSLARSIPLVIGLMLLGHVLSCAYVVYALYRSNGDWTRFWTGRPANEPSHAGAAAN